MCTACCIFLCRGPARSFSSCVLLVHAALKHILDSTDGDSAVSTTCYSTNVLFCCWLAGQFKSSAAANQTAKAAAPAPAVATAQEAVRAAGREAASEAAKPAGAVQQRGNFTASNKDRTRSKKKSTAAVAATHEDRPGTESYSLSHSVLQSIWATLWTLLV